MSETLYTGLLLLVVGMGTVFAVLSLVVMTGRFLISTVNKYGPVQPPVVATAPAEDQITGKTVAILASVVNNLTQGKGSITHIERLEDEKRD